MRIKRFQAPDMRTALRMVRDEQGPDAVILSNRATANGIEVVAATDYDESLMSQALRAAAPGLEPLPAPVVRAASQPALQVDAAPMPARAAAAATVEAARTEAPSMAQLAAAQVMAARDAASRRAAETTPLAAPTAAIATAGAATAAREPARESLISRARAIFRIGDAPASEGPTLAELVPQTTAASAPSVGRTLDIRVDDSLDVADEIVAPETPAPDVAVARATANDAVTPVETAPPEAEVTFESLIATFQAPAAAEPVAERAPTMGEPAPQTSPYAQASDADYLIALSTPGAVTAPAAPVIAAPPRSLQAVPAPRTDVADPSIAAMREELASMRVLMEKQLEQLSLERLRGSPARAAVLDAMLDFGCDDAMAQTIAAAIDPRLAGVELQAALAAQFAQAIPALQAEPIDDGGVIALVGPTGAGKTTVAAKLAARFAARHGARNVAMVSVDRERTGAREQLHAYGRRLGVTVCDAESADELGQALDQLGDYPLVLVDTTGYGVRDRALLRQILWLRSSSCLRSLLVLPANANPHDLAEIARRYRPAAPQGVVLTKLDETGRAGAALSVLAAQGLPLAYTSAGQQIPHDLQAADAAALAPELAPRLEKTTRAAVNPLATEDRHAFA